MLKTTFVLFAALWMTGCATNRPASLDTPVHSEKGIIYRYQYAMTSPDSQPGMEFKDGMIFCRVLPGELSIGLDIINLSDAPITIDWNEVRLIDPEGGSHRILHNMVLLRDLHRTHTPTVIMPQGVLNESVAPMDYAFLDFSGWQQRPIFPKTEEALEFNGLKYGVSLPVKTEERVSTYLFEIEVTGVTRDVIVR